LTATAPLAGIRVLDLTNVLAGPFCCHQLAHLGADVVKVEAPGRGDLARQLGADAELNAAGMGVSFLAQNAGKRSMTVNLKHPSGKAVLKRLVCHADVLVENFRPGVMDRLGVGPDVLRAENPRLIYAAISGFGQDGPWRDRPAYDQIVQGAAGVMSVTGQPGGDPTRVGYPMADTIGGLTAAMAISAALNADPRGCVIDVSMMEAVLATMGWAVSNWLIAGRAPGRVGNENVTSAPSGAFRAVDGLLNIAANRDTQWEALARHLGRDDLLDHPDYATRESRIAHRDTLRVELETVLATRPAADWARELSALGVPAGAVLSVPDALAHPQVAARDLVATYPDAPGTGRDVRALRTAVKIDGAAPAVDAPPPVLGAHTDALLAEAGFPPAEIAALRAEGAL
jgi:formyl-CoA transferase